MLAGAVDSYIYIQRYLEMSKLSFFIELPCNLYKGENKLILALLRKTIRYSM